MKILITNDDGIHSPGLSALRSALEPHHEVWVVAPDGERSGTSHSLTLKEPIKCVPVAERMFACSGTPADCVILAYLGAIPVTPDVVVAGINIGPNLGTDVLYSGTAAAARQAAIMGYPGIATSIAGFVPPFYFKGITSFVVENLDILCSLWDQDHFININGPNVDNPVPPVRITRLARRIYQDRLVHYESPRGESYYFLDGYPIQNDDVEESDTRAVDQGALSLSPVYLNPTDLQEIAAYKEAQFRAKEA